MLRWYSLSVVGRGGFVRQKGEDRAGEERERAESRKSSIERERESQARLDPGKREREKRKMKWKETEQKPREMEIVCYGVVVEQRAVKGDDGRRLWLMTIDDDDDLAMLLG